jgi:RNA 2',3'-cyclic 3'-phosphodiesterase
MPRLFVALPIPDTITERIAALKTDIPSARWVKPAHMHLTLRFIGADVPDERVEPIKVALATVALPSPFPLTVAGVGRFPPSRKKAPRVLWVGIQPQPVLLTLHEQIERALATVGYKPSKQSFKPHVTLARLRTHKPAREAARFIEAQAAFTAGTFYVEKFILYNSTLTPQGSRYQHEAVYMSGDIKE